MTKLKQHDDTESLVQARQDEEPLHRLVRSVLTLTESYREPGSEPPVNATSDQVVFDIDVDGERYILIKTTPADRSLVSLSPREREIVRMVANGHQSKVIAAVLNISSWTVCTHLRRIFAKLGVSSRAAMVAKVAESGFIDLKETLEAPLANRNSACGAKIVARTTPIERK